MAKPELGEKRTCPSCGAKYYDLNRDPIVCPKCSTTFEVMTAKAKPAKADQTKAAVNDEEDVEDEVDGPEIISLEDAEDDDGDTVDGDEDSDVPDDIPDVDVDDDEDDDSGPFLEDDDEDDENLGDIIPRSGDDKEEV